MNLRSSFVGLLGRGQPGHTNLQKKPEYEHHPAQSLAIKSIKIK